VRQRSETAVDARLIRKLAGYVLAAALGAAGALFYDAAHDIAALRGRVETAWSDVVLRYGARGDAVSAFVVAAKAAGGADTGKLEEALATLVKIPVPDTPNDLGAFRRWEQAEINVSMTLADLFRSIPGAANLNQSGEYAMALSRLEGTESGIDEAAGRYNRAIAAYEDASAKGLPAWILSALILVLSETTRENALADPSLTPSVKHRQLRCIPQRNDDRN
jgi:LemA protein